jgi:hypothetical protein
MGERVSLLDFTSPRAKVAEVSASGRLKAPVVKNKLAADLLRFEKA